MKPLRALFRALSTLRAVLMVYGRLEMGKLAVLGALSATLLFTGITLAMILGWVWYRVTGAPLVRGSELLNGQFDISTLVVMPIIWITLQICKGRFLLSAQTARLRQQDWQDVHWQLWHANGPYSIGSINFVMVMFGAATLLCLFAGLLVAIMG
jgi:hypothetical protein